jgi:ribosome-associated heat shock protein Hsp15
LKSEVERACPEWRVIPSGGFTGVSLTTSQRLDQWLWFARVTKSRTLAQALIERGKVRVNREKVARPSQLLKAGDAVTVTLGPKVRILTVKAVGTRRGPASEAQTLFQELTPTPDQTKSSEALKTSDTEEQVGDVANGMRPVGAGRPTKRERRQTVRLKDRFREC